MVAEGHKLEVIADTFGISKARVSQINQEYHEDVTDDAYRELQRNELEYVLHDILYPMLRGPGKRLVSPSGKPVYEMSEDGKSLDMSRPIYDEYAKVDVAKAIVPLQERIAKLYALDRPKAKEKDESPEFAEAMSYVRKLAGRVKELQSRLSQYEEDDDVVEAEVVPDEENPGSPGSHQDSPPASS